MTLRVTGSNFFQMGADKSQVAGVLSILLKELPDEFLKNHFHDLGPEQVRNILQEEADRIAPEHGNEKSTPSQAPLWQDNEKTWAGKLAGRILQLFSDGASRGNPGEAGAGIVILDEKGNEWLLNFGSFSLDYVDEEDPDAEFGYSGIRLELA